MNFIIVNCMTATKINAMEIANYLVEAKLAACVNIVPHVSSVYEWEGNIVEGQEFLLIIKTKEKLFKTVEQAIKERHEYAMPEIVATKIEHGNKDYLQWLKTATA